MFLHAACFNQIIKYPLKLGQWSIMANSSKPPVYSDNAKRWLKLFLPYLPRVFVFVILLLCFASTAFCETPTKDRRTRRSSETRPTGQAQAAPQESGEAITKIPWDDLSPQAKGRIKGVVSQHSVFWRLPQQRVYSDPEMFSFLVEHPDIVVAFWEKLGVTQISLREQKDGRFLMKECTGTTAIAEVIYRSKDICIVHGRGQYLGPFLAKAYNGDAILVLRSRFQRDENEEPYVVCDLDAFVRIDNVGADLFARLFATSLGKIADSNFEQTVAFVSHVSQAASMNPESVKNLGWKLNEVREDVRGDFEGVVERVAMRSARRSERMIHYEWAVDAGLQSPSTAYTIPHEVPVTLPTPLPMTSSTSLDVSSKPIATGHSFYGQTPPQHLFTYQQIAPKRIRDDSERPLSSVAVSKEGKASPMSLDSHETPAPLLQPEDVSPVVLEVSTEVVPVPKSRVVFGTPKIAKQTEAAE